jgi:hypothetical protein
VRPQITDLALSPTGRWLMLVRWKSDQDMVIEFFDLIGREHVSDVPLLEDNSLVEWGSAPSKA